jgi:hypothetical protein|nr:MAG TPA: hypothetical protein [Caudoviricetes sp.]
MATYVFAAVEDNSYDPYNTFDSYEEAISRAICGEEIAVLDALSLELYGTIR